jgi:hypothetical protein
LADLFELYDDAQTSKLENKSSFSIGHMPNNYAG